LTADLMMSAYIFGRKNSIVTVQGGFMGRDGVQMSV